MLNADINRQIVHPQKHRHYDPLKVLLIHLEIIPMTHTSVTYMGNVAMYFARHDYLILEKKTEKNPKKTPRGMVGVI